MENTLYTLTTRFIDNDKNSVTVTVKITEKENFLQCSFTGKSASSCGQIDFSPKNAPQHALQDFWKKYHLNDMRAGTPAQEKALEKHKKVAKRERLDYDTECAFLESVGLLVDNGYKYGTGWQRVALPENLNPKEKPLYETMLNAIFDSIEKAEREEYGDDVVTDYAPVQDKLRKEYGDNAPRAFALARHLRLSLGETLDTVTVESDAQLVHGGQPYYVAEEDVIEEVAKERIENYMEEEIGILHSHLRDFFDEERYIEVAMQERTYGEILNSYDGTQHKLNVGDTLFYIIEA